MTDPVASSRVPRGASLALLGLSYFLAASAAVCFTRFESGVAFLWIATALLLADLRDRAPRRWIAPVLTCGAAGAAVTLLFGLGWRAAGPLALANMIEAAGGAWLLCRFSRARGRFEALGDIAALIAASGLLMPAVTAFLGAGVVHWVADVPYWSNWLSWFSGHALGALTVTPLAVLIREGNVSAWLAGSSARDRREAFALLALVAAVSAAVFAQTRFPLLFLPFLPVMIAVFRLGRLGAAASLLLLTLIGAGFSLNGLGPVALIHGGAGVRAQFLLFYLAVATLMTLPAAADLSHRKRLFQQLQDSVALLKLVTERTGDAILALERDGVIRYASPAIERLGGISPTDAKGRRATDLIEPDDVAEVTRVHRQALARPDETFIVEYRARRADGAIGWFETHTRATVNARGEPSGAVSVIREVSGRKARELDLDRAAHLDPLTGLANRRGLQLRHAHLRAQAGEGASGCVALFDLDHFKQVNDRHGHAIGDRVLEAFAALLRDSLRETDVPARLGGEEFVVLLASADIAAAEAVCERVRALFAATPLTGAGGQPLQASVSAGLARIPPDGNLDAAIAAADAALYQAKAAGRNRLALAA